MKIKEMDIISLSDTTYCEIQWYQEVVTENQICQLSNFNSKH